MVRILHLCPGLEPINTKKNTNSNLHRSSTQIQIMIRIGTAPRGNVMKNFAPGPGAYSEQLVNN